MQVRNHRSKVMLEKYRSFSLVSRKLDLYLFSKMPGYCYENDGTANHDFVVYRSTMGAGTRIGE